MLEKTMLVLGLIFLILQIVNLAITIGERIWKMLEDCNIWIKRK